MASRDPEGQPEIPEGLLTTLIQELEGEDAPFVKHLDKELELKWLDEDESRLGFTRFELGHHELYRRRRLSAPPGPITIALNPILSDDGALFRHTLQLSSPSDLPRVYERFAFNVYLGGGQYRIRTRVTGLEGQHDIQTTPIARDPLRGPHLDEPSL